jgi:hypothetical protein
MRSGFSLEHFRGLMWTSGKGDFLQRILMARETRLRLGPCFRNQRQTMAGTSTGR